MMVVWMFGQNNISKWNNELSQQRTAYTNKNHFDYHMFFCLSHQLIAMWFIPEATISWLFGNSIDASDAQTISTIAEVLASKIASRFSFVVSFKCNAHGVLLFSIDKEVCFVIVKRHRIGLFMGYISFRFVSLRCSVFLRTQRQNIAALICSSWSRTQKSAQWLKEEKKNEQAMGLGYVFTQLNIQYQL